MRLSRVINEWVAVYRWIGRDLMTGMIELESRHLRWSHGTRDYTFAYIGQRKLHVLLYFYGVWVH